jgi:hypothetical protein
MTASAAASNGDRVQLFLYIHGDVVTFLPVLRTSTIGNIGIGPPYKKLLSSFHKK